MFNKLFPSTFLAALPSLAMSTPSNLPNIIIINADDLGYGDISCNGDWSQVKTPNVDKLAQEGIRFTNFHACAATSTPSRFSLLTGQYAWRVPGTGIARGDAAMIVTPEMKTLPGMLQRGGYATAAIGKWHLGLGSEQGKQNWNGEITPGLKDIGFDYSFIMAATGDRVPCVYIENGCAVNLEPNDPIEVSYTQPYPNEPTGKKNPELLKLHPSHGHDQAIVNGISRIGYMKGGEKARWIDEEIADRITEKAVEFIEKNAAKPFFLYFATNDIHVPRAPHSRFVGKSGMGARGDAILSFDWSVGEILNAIEKLSIADNTLIILTSDNGPVIDDGYKDQAVELLGNHQPCGSMRGGKYSIFEAGTRVPAIARWKKEIKAGQVSDAAMSQIDIFATLTALTRQNLQADEAPDSQNHLNVLLGNDQHGRHHIIEHAGTHSITVKNWKYIVPIQGETYDAWTNTELGNNTIPQLYNLKNDGGEKKNLAEQYPQKVAELETLLKYYLTNNDR